jgi:hypothetical protein
MHNEILAVIAALSTLGTAASTYYARLFYLKAKDLAALASNCRSDAADYVALAKAEAASVRESEGLVKADLRMSNDVMNYVLATAALHKASAEQLELDTKAAASKALDHASTAAEFAAVAGNRAKVSEEHATAAAEHRAACHDHVIDASEHASTASRHAGTAEGHARSVGALSVAVTDIAAKANVRLVHRDNYSNEGSNIGGR